MTSPNDQTWRKDYLGREQELKWLQEAWETAKSGTPQLRVLTAESGYGKTKVAQLFYAWLAEFQQGNSPEKYWPQTLLQEHNSLRVMPEMDGIEAKAEIPWFWWGARWEHPEGHNRCSVTSPLIAAREDPAFLWHCKSLSAGLDDRKALGTIGVTALKMGLAYIFPASAIVSGAVAAASHLSEIYDAVCVWKSHKKDRTLRSEISNQQQEATKTFLATCALILGKNSIKKGTLPMVLLLDDSQWMDAVSVNMVRELWDLAIQNSWPLLIIGTHWEGDWNAGHSSNQDPGSDSYALWVKSLTGFQTCSTISSYANKRSSQAEQWRLGKLPEVDELLKRAFKGLTAAQINMFTQRVSGNPRHMQEVILLLAETKDEWFEDGNLDLPLLPHGVEEAMNSDLDLEKLERRRFNKAATEIKQIIGAGSAQGGRFVNQFASDVAGLLGLKVDKEKLLEEAIDPLALAEKYGDACTEFRSRTIHESAKKFLRNTSGADRISKAIIQTACVWSRSGRLDSLTRDLAERLLVLVYDTGKGSDDPEEYQSIFDLFVYHGKQQELKYFNPYTAYSAYGKALQLTRDIESRLGATEGLRHRQAKALHLLACLAIEDHDFLSSSTLVNECLSLCQSNLELFGDSPVALRDSIKIAVWFGRIQDLNGEDEEARRHFDRAKVLSIQLLDLHGSTSENLSCHLFTLSAQAYTPESMSGLMEGIDRMRTLGENTPEHNDRICSALGWAASSLEEQQFLAQALVLRQEATELTRKQIARWGEDRSRLLSLSGRHFSQSLTLRDLNRIDESNHDLETARSLIIDYFSRYGEDAEWYPLNNMIHQALETDEDDECPETSDCGDSQSPKSAGAIGL